MRKKLLASVLAAGILSTSSAFAAEATAETMFSTVPKDHWAYGAVQQLVHDGLINGYGDDDFRGEKPISRYEMAKFVAMAMTNAKKASMEDKKTMDDLQQEYTLELTKLNVRLQNLEARTSSFKWFGDARVRSVSGSNETQTNLTQADKSHKIETRLRLGFWGEPAKNLSVFGRIKAENGTAKVNDAGKADNGRTDWSNNFGIESLALTWNRGNTSFIFGRPLITMGQGLIWWESAIDGIVVDHKFAKNLSAMVAIGDQAPGIWADKYVGGILAGVNWDMNRKTNITLTYRNTNNTNYTTKTYSATTGTANGTMPYKYRQVALGFNTQLSNKYNLRVEGITNRASGLPSDAQRNGWWAKLTYGHQVWKKAHTFELYAHLFSHKSK